MNICYSRKSRPSAFALADALDDMDVDAAINRHGSGDINWGRNYADTQLNPDISNSTNKRVMRELFVENDVPMPELYTPDELREMIDDGEELHVIGRPDHHSKGRGMWHVRTIVGYRRAMRGTNKKKPATHFMEYIDAPREYRVHIFKGRSIRISEKRFGEDGETNAGGYITVKPQHEIRHVRRAAKKAMEAVELDFGAIDILADDENCWVLEVNAAPHLGGSLPALYARKFTEWYEEER